MLLRISALSVTQVDPHSDNLEEENAASISSLESKVTSPISLFVAKEYTDLDLAAAKSKSVYSLATNREIGEVTFDSSDDIEAAFSSSKLSEWGSTCVTERADILNNIASSLEDDPYEILKNFIRIIFERGGDVIKNICPFSYASRSPF